MVRLNVLMVVVESASIFQLKGNMNKYHLEAGLMVKEEGAAVKSGFFCSRLGISFWVHRSDCGNILFCLFILG